MPETKTDSIAGFRCLRCGNVSFPRHTRCRSCRNTEFEQIPLKKGKVVTSTRLTATRPGFASELVLAIAEFEHGVRVLGQVQGAVIPPQGVAVTIGEGVLGQRKDRSERRGFMLIPPLQPEKGRK
jgi:uncharacterized OB-fold protein